jgi:hypothetical protein
LAAPWLAKYLGRDLTETEMTALLAAPAIVAHWIETTPVLVPVRAWWGGKKARELSPEQMSQVVREVVKLAVPVLAARIDRDNLKQ